MLSEFQKYQKAKKIDWPIIVISVFMSALTVYLAVRCVQ